MSTYILSIHQRTAGTWAVILDRKANVAASAYAATTQYLPQLGWVEQDANEIWMTSLRVIAEALQNGRIAPEQIDAIGIANQRDTTVFWNKKTGEPVGRAIVWQDQRTLSICEQLIAKDKVNMVGAFLGALGVYLTYMDGLKAAGMPNVWCTGPGSVFGQTFWGTAAAAGVSSAGGYSFVNAFITEIIGTAVLLWGILASGDSKNLGLMHNMGPFLVGGTVLSVGLSLGGPSGYAINPARDLGPRLFGLVAGTQGLFADGYWWIPVVAPIVGGLIGIYLYDWFVTAYLPKK